MSHLSDPSLRVLHAVRTLGYADTDRIAAKAGMENNSAAVPDATEHLLAAQARGWIMWTAFAGDGGWSLTEDGKTHGERLLAAELDAIGARSGVSAVYEDFLPLNVLVARACTEWQLTELDVSTDPVSLTATLEALQRGAEALESLEIRLVAHLNRFAGYRSRFLHAVGQAATDPGWITSTERDSAHRVWFELHEDLIATLGLTR